uniref:Uncharacterized protein n=1 Tax=Faecalibaculum rodentium TaxID=1702221 RepID=A0A140DWM8_9FIRM|nr:hypothetical protein AALO17_19210 [Faecalibaculum rodentium]
MKFRRISSSSKKRIQLVYSLGHAPSARFFLRLDESKQTFLKPQKRQVPDSGLSFDAILHIVRCRVRFNVPVLIHFSSMGTLWTEACSREYPFLRPAAASAA